jgi:hypothetical protein
MCDFARTIVVPSCLQTSFAIYVKQKKGSQKRSPSSYNPPNKYKFFVNDRENPMAHRGEGDSPEIVSWLHV